MCTLLYLCVCSDCFDNHLLIDDCHLAFTMNGLFNDNKLALIVLFLDKGKEWRKEIKNGYIQY